jgi:hypothetical protein
MATKTTRVNTYEETMRADVMNDLQITAVDFKSNDKVEFAPVEGGMQVVMKHRLLPRFEGNFFNPDFLAFLRDQGVSGFVQDYMYDAVDSALRKGQVMEAVMDCMK